MSERAPPADEAALHIADGIANALGLFIVALIALIRFTLTLFFTLLRRLALAVSSPHVIDALCDSYHWLCGVFELAFDCAFRKTVVRFEDPNCNPPIRPVKREEMVDSEQRPCDSQPRYANATNPVPRTPRTPRTPSRASASHGASRSPYSTTFWENEASLMDAEAFEVDDIVPLFNRNGTKIGEVIPIYEVDNGIRDKWYAVTRGTSVGVFQSWTRVAPLVTGVSGVQSSYLSREDAVTVFRKALLSKSVHAIQS